MGYVIARRVNDDAVGVDFGIINGSFEANVMGCEATGWDFKLVGIGSESTMMGYESARRGYVRSETVHKRVNKEGSNIYKGRIKGGRVRLKNT